jgi:hypothetical protein
VLIKRLASIGIKVDIDPKAIDRQLSPAMYAISNELKKLTKENEKASKAGIFGSDFWGEKVKAFTGFDVALFKSTKTMIGYGVASKKMDIDNQEFYKSLNPIQKLLTSTAGLFTSKAKAQQDAAEQDKQNVGTTNELTAVLNQAENAITQIGPAAEEAAVGVEVFASAATLGLAAVAAIVVGIGVGFYKMFMQAVVARDEFKKFDQLFGGLGRSGVTQGISELANLNKELWGLGMSLEAVNSVVLDATKQGLNYHRALDKDFVGPILELSGATGVAASEIGNLYTELYKTTRIDKSSLANIGNSFIQFNKFAESTTTLGQLSFAQFKTGIESSANALAIASVKGKNFTDSMIKDLSTLSGLAQTLSLDVSQLNSKFEEAGSLITDQSSGFRNLLAISGGANINQMLTNQFDKTDAMLKGVKFLQEFNKSFGGNIQLTAQVAQTSLGISKEMAIKMINMRQETIDDMIKAQRDISGIQTDATKEAFEKVNSDLSSMWNRVKTMFVTFFQNAFGSSGGMQGLLTRVEDFLGRLRNYLQNASWIEKLSSIIDKIATFIAEHLEPIITFLGKKLDEFSSTDSANPLVTLWDTLVGVFKRSAKFIGNLIGQGFVSGIWNGLKWGGALDQTIWGFGGDKTSTEEARSDSTFKTPDAAEKLLQGDISRIDAEKARYSKYSPDTVTYGDRGGTAGVGFMTVGQAEFKLKQEKAAAEAALKVYRDRSLKAAEETAAATKKLAKDSAPYVDKNSIVDLDNAIAQGAVFMGA